MSLDQREEETTTTVPAPPCGELKDGDQYFLWTEVKKFVPCDGHRSVVARGSAGSDKHYLLVPTDRVTGIECECIQGGYDYWQEARRLIPFLFRPPSPVNPEQIGLGINSLHNRQQEQLHIHIAQFLPAAQLTLRNNESNIPYNAWNEWTNGKAVVPIITKEDSTKYRQYRVIRTDQNTSNLNLFAALKQYVNHNMADQTLILIPRVGGGWYVLNSEPDLGGGTGTCDHLLLYT
ncbi:CDP-diacylglycerol diphosphatase [Streptomyces avermitilis]|uniref:CDP-diacylglycerol diphosphatase n=1 Tax=Streptomyces avermitilis TaxID=33903 RepID=UPI00381A0098